jgi:hypothetical protein
MGCSVTRSVLSQPPGTARTGFSMKDRRLFLRDPASRQVHAYPGALRRMLRVGVRIAKTPAGFFAAAISSPE